MGRTESGFVYQHGYRKSIDPDRPKKSHASSYLLYLACQLALQRPVIHSRQAKIRADRWVHNTKQNRPHRRHKDFPWDLKPKLDKSVTLASLSFHGDLAYLGKGKRRHKVLS